MFDEKDMILEAKHITRKFPAAGGRTLVACNDINLKMYKGKHWVWLVSPDAESQHL